MFAAKYLHCGCADGSRTAEGRLASLVNGQQFDNKLTMTFDRVSIFGNNLSASFGMVVKKNKK